MRYSGKTSPELQSPCIANRGIIIFSLLGYRMGRLPERNSGAFNNHR
jgi:hypothetical protein